MGHHHRVALGRADIGGQRVRTRTRASYLRTGAGWDDHRARRGGRLQGRHPRRPVFGRGECGGRPHDVTAGVATRSDWQVGGRARSDPGPSTARPGSGCSPPTTRITRAS